VTFAKLSPLTNIPPTDAQLSSVRKSQFLNNGWPYSDGPEHWGWAVEPRDNEIHGVCTECGRAFFLMAPGPGRGYVVTTDIIKSRLADHVLRCHEAEIADQTRT